MFGDDPEAGSVRRILCGKQPQARPQSTGIFSSVVLVEFSPIATGVAVEGALHFLIGKRLKGAGCCGQLSKRKY